MVIPSTTLSLDRLNSLFQRNPAALLPLVEELFDHLPDTVFFCKDAQGRYVSVNQTLAERCGVSRKSDLVGRRVSDFFPPALAQRYAAQDEAVLKSGRSMIDVLELHWFPGRRSGWCLTTKLPIETEKGLRTGLIGISRDVASPDERDSIPATLAPTLEYLENNCHEPILPSTLAKQAGLSNARFARLIRRLFRLTPSQLIIQTRLNHAAKALEDSDKPVTEVALLAGFYDHSAFSRAFRRATGLTPSAFRNRNRTSPHFPLSS